MNIEKRGSKKLEKELRERFNCKQTTGKETFFTVIDRELATWVLEKCNLRNRKINERRIIQYSNDMKNNKWDVTGETISFDKYGITTNGQHTLESIKRTNIPQEIIVVFGLTPESQLKRDQGGKRTLGQGIHMFGDGVPKGMQNKIASLLNFKHNYYNGKYINGYRISLSYEDALMEYMEYKKYIDHIIVTIRKAGSGYNSACVLAAILRGYIKYGEAKMNPILEQITTGEGLTKSNPILVWREIIHNWIASKSTQNDSKKEEIYRKTVATIDACINGVRVKDKRTLGTLASNVK